MDDIIAAVATAWGESAIAVIRLSGPGSVALVDTFFAGRHSLEESPPRHMTLGNITEAGNGRIAVLDQVLAVRFDKGASYTGEESVEVHCHGGSAAVQKCMEIFLKAGARLAFPGEFTKRAFLSGRIDLAQAEAVIGVIRAQSDAALQSANRSLQGELSRRLRILMNALTGFRAGLEVRLDYPEEVDDHDTAEILEGLKNVREKTRSLVDRCRVGVMLRNGLGVAILGRPNVGKSSLLNALAGEERAIVTEIPGTTRDTVDTSIVHRGLAIRIIDTAGIRESHDVIESIGIERSLAAMSGADLCLLVLDSSVPVSEADKEVWNRAAAKSGKPVILVLNKCDQPRVTDKEDAEFLALPGQAARIVKVSARTGAGLSLLKDAIFDLALGDASVEESYAATERMVEALLHAFRCMEEAETAIREDIGVDVAGSLLAEASSYLAAPLGADATEELLDTIFSTFCVGK